MTDISDYLMKEAAKADEKADGMFAEAEAKRLTVDAHLAGISGDVLRAQIRAMDDRAFFYRGQASGFRQATFIVLQYTGTPVHD